MALCLTETNPKPRGIELFRTLDQGGTDSTGSSSSPWTILSSVMGFVQEARDNHVKKKVEEALRSKMKQKALKECDHYTAKYAQCASGRTISVVWQCRKQAKQLNDCLHQFTNDAVLEEMKKEYILQHPGEGEGSARI